MPRALRSLKHDNYRLFITGQFVSVIGSWMQSVAQGWLLYNLTHSEFYLGVLGFMSGAPALLLSPIAGAFADHHERRRIVLVCQMLFLVCALTMAILTFTGKIEVWQILSIALVMACIDCFDIPARQALMSDLVGPDDLMNAIAINATIFNLARLIGPAMAGYIADSTGEAWCFLINAVSFLAVICALIAIKIQNRVVSTGELQVRKRIREGFEYLKGHRPVKTLLLLIGMAGLTTLPYSVFMPVFAKHVLHGNAKTLGTLFLAIGIGALFAAISLARRDSLRGLGKRVGLATIGIGLFLVLFSMSRTIWLSFALLIPVGYFVMTLLSCTNTMIQSMVPNEMRGRMLGFYTIMFMGIPPLGSLMLGSLAEWLTAPVVVGAAGGLCSLFGFLYLRVLPDLKDHAEEIFTEEPNESWISKIL